MSFYTKILLHNMLIIARTVLRLSAKVKTSHISVTLLHNILEQTAQQIGGKSLLLPVIPGKIEQYRGRLL